VLALELYHREQGKWPASMDDLAPRWLPSVPKDSITGKSLHYKIVNDRPLVYSVGVDGDDDGGRVTKDMSGEVHSEYAKPRSQKLQLRGVPEADGDWLLWSTTKNE